MLGLAELIIEEFERNYPIPTSVEDWREGTETIALYLAALKYVDRYG